jgi:hypothetical protein
MAVGIVPVTVNAASLDALAASVVVSKKTAL